MTRQRPTGAEPTWTLGVDTGGTFTDIVYRDRRGQRVLKVPSTPDDPARAIVDGLRRLFAEMRGEPRGGAIVHGSTVATNAILERKGARTAFVTTGGFADLVEIGRQNRPALYDLAVSRPAPLVPRELRLEIGERVLSDGAVEGELDEVAARAALESLAGRVDSLAIGFVFSFLRDDHERAVARLAERVLPGVPVSLSSRVSPEIREYERFSTTILNAYVMPVMAAYLDRLERRLPGNTIEIMGSGGGTVPLSRARVEPVLTVLSGPAAGVLGARDVARRAGFPRAVTFDMGGTSTDVSLVDGDVAFRNESTIGGLPFRVPVIDVHTVGAGGGSIARVDAGGSLQVGPESAGADPGPAVYGKGSGLTVTDAHVFLGHLAGDSFLGGGMEIAPERAVPLVAALATRLSLSPVELAQGVVRVVNAAMERALRVVSQERGHDPREFTLVAFGGASGLHAAALARGLLMPRVLVPPHPGMLCAWGMLAAERVRWRARTVGRLAREYPAARIRKLARELLDEARADFKGVARGELEERVELDLRFEGQTHVVTLQPKRGRAARSDLDDYEAAFREHYRERYRVVDDPWEVELIAVRVALAHRRARVPRPRPRAATRRRPTPRGTRRMALELSTRRVEVAVYDRDALEPGQRIVGPALIAEYSGTTLVPEDFDARVDGWGNLLLALR